MSAGKALDGRPTPLQSADLFGNRGRGGGRSSWSDTQRLENVVEFSMCLCGPNVKGVLVAISPESMRVSTMATLRRHSQCWRHHPIYPPGEATVKIAASS